MNAGGSRTERKNTGRNAAKCVGLKRFGAADRIRRGRAGLCDRVARADDYPNKPVRLVVGFIPGSAADITARVLGNRMGQILGQQFVVETKPGAGSSLAADFAARAPKDGYTLFLGSSANVTNSALNSNLSDISKDFAPIALATTVPVMLVVHPSTGVNSVAELIALAKSKPGEVLYASTGVGTAPHLAGELFTQRAGIKLVHVPYQGSPQAVTDLLAGRTTDDVLAGLGRAAAGQGRQAQGAGLGRDQAPRGRCPNCRPWRRPACPTSTPGSGSG